MEDSTKQIIKGVAILAAGYFVYDWLQSSGLWAQWFGGASVAAPNSFSNSTALLTYCQANPTGTAVFVDPTTGASSTATCAQWMSSNPQTTPLPAASTSAPPSAIAAMQAANGSDSATLDDWSYYWQNLPTFSGAPSGFGVNGSISATLFNQILGLNGGNRTAEVSAEQFVSWLNTASGMSGLMLGAGDDQGFYPDPNAWVN